MFQRIFLIIWLFLPLTLHADLRLLDHSKIKANQIGTCKIYHTDAKNQHKAIVRSYSFDSEGYPTIIKTFSVTNTNTTVFAYRYTYYGDKKKIRERYRLDVNPIMIENFIYADPFNVYITRDNGLQAIWTNAKMIEMGDHPLLEIFQKPDREVRVSYAYNSSNKIIDWKDSLLNHEIYLYDKTGNPFSRTIFLRGTEEARTTMTYETDPKTALPSRVEIHNAKNKLIGINVYTYSILSNTVNISGKISKGKVKDDLIRIRHAFTLENEKTQKLSANQTFSFDLPVNEPGIYEIVTAPNRSVLVAVYPHDKIFVNIDAKNNKILKSLGSDQGLKIQKMEKELFQFKRANRRITKYDISNWLLFKLKDLSPSLVHLYFLDQIMVTKNNLTSIEALISQLLHKYPRNIKLHTFIRNNKLDTVK